MLISRILRATHLSAYSASGALPSDSFSAQEGELVALLDAPALPADAEGSDGSDDQRLLL